MLILQYFESILNTNICPAEKRTKRSSNICTAVLGTFFCGTDVSNSILYWSMLCRYDVFNFDQNFSNFFLVKAAYFQLSPNFLGEVEDDENRP